MDIVKFAVTTTVGLGTIKLEKTKKITTAVVIFILFVSDMYPLLMR